ncbi:hypothetical protein NPIL_673181 [Nephila pilipes]|uniref:Uncharacterized protein n=1 Tax=Nephila pilipes TaxID=299642 RepID=A0A8X6MIG5_NEPPI|nr:hypothetical protein NPIL_673181 [Nephila pilipes]
MTDAITLVTEICLYLLYWVILVSDLPSLLEIIGYSISVELLKICSLPESSIGDILSGSGSAYFHENSTHDRMSVLSSFAVLEVCQAPELKESLVP